MEKYQVLGLFSKTGRKTDEVRSSKEKKVIFEDGKVECVHMQLKVKCGVYFLDMYSIFKIAQSHDSICLGSDIQKIN